MLTAEKPNSLKVKRTYRPFWSLHSVPLCSKCKVPCIVRSTPKSGEFGRIQKRYCPNCGEPHKTPYSLKSE